LTQYDGPQSETEAFEVKRPGQWTRMIHLFPMLQADPPEFEEVPPPRKPPEPPVEEFEETQELPPPQPEQRGLPPPPPPMAPEPEEFEEASAPAQSDQRGLPPPPPMAPAPEEFEEAPPPGGAPPVQAPDEYEGAPPSGTLIPGQYEEPAGPAPTGPPPEEFEAPEMRIARPAEAPEEFGEAPPPGVPAPEEFEEPGQPAGPAAPEAFEVTPETVEETTPVSLRSAPPREGDQIPGSGPAKGITNGRGRTNGRGLTNGRGRTNGRGLTNGGLTNGRGGVNGRGLVNGRRKGLVNGAGLTNGAGLVNGRRRRGLVNGSGLVNGNGFINGRGLVNGKGLINGQGLTNGRQLTTAEVVPTRPKVRRNVGLAAAAIAVALLIIIPVLYYTQVQKGVAIDGIFDDWKGVTNKYSDGDALPSPGTDANIDISEFGASATDTDLSFYVKVAGSMLGGANGGVDTLTIFISTGRAGSGYRVNTPGGVLDAQYKLEIFGYDGSVRSASYSKFDSTDINDYNGWTSLGAARAAASGSQLEASIWFQGTELGRGSDASILFYLRNAGGEEDYSDFTIGLNTGVLAVKQRDPSAGGDGATVQLELGAYGRQVNFTQLRVTKAGSAGGGLVTLTGAGVSQDGSFGGNEALISGFVVGIPQDSKVLLSLNAHGFSGGAFGMYISGSNGLTATTGGRAVHVSVSGYSNVLYYLGGASAGRIDIDGAFEDWEATRGQPGWDSRGDGSDDFEEPSKAGSPGLVDRGGIVHYNDENINLLEVAEYAPGGGTAWYYARVSGQALGGQVVPATKRGLPPTYGTGAAGEPPERVGSDVFYVLIDNDGNKETGYIVRNTDGDPVIGAGYCVVISGKNGQVLNQKSFTWDSGGGWRDGGPSPNAAAGGKKIEVAVGGLSLSPGHKALIIAEDWTGNADRSDFTIGASSGRSDMGTTLEVNEADASRHAVQVGSKQNPMFQLQMDSYGGAVEVTGIELTRDGSAKDEDITGVHLTLDADGNGVFSRTDPEIAGEVRFTDGKATFQGAGSGVPGAGEPIVTVVPGARVILFVAIDVSPGATLYTTIGLGATYVDSNADIQAFTNSQPTNDVVITKTGGRGSNQIVINEVGKQTDGSTDYVSWIEIWNPTNSDGKGLEISATNSDDKLWKVKFDVAAGTYVIITPVDPDYIPWGNTIYLKDKPGGTTIDSVGPPSILDGYSYARYVDTDGLPMLNSWYTDSTPTYGTKNDTIPEFQDVLLPIMGTIVLFVLFRQQKHSSKRRKNKSNTVDSNARDPC